MNDSDHLLLLALRDRIDEDPVTVWERLLTWFAIYWAASFLAGIATGFAIAYFSWGQ